METERQEISPKNLDKNNDDYLKEIKNILEEILEEIKKLNKNRSVN